MRPEISSILKEPANGRIAVVVLLAGVLFSLPLAAQVTLTLSPNQAAVNVTESQDFTAVVNGTTDKTVRWKVCDRKGKGCIVGGDSQVGTIVDIGIDAEGNHIGRYTAPSLLPYQPFCKLVVGGCQLTVKAKLVGRKKQARASVKINYPPPPPGTARLSFVRTDNGPWDVAYEPTQRLVFAGIEGLNQVGVFSAESKQRIATISVPLPMSLDRTPDGTRILVGTLVEAIYVIDPVTLQLIERVIPPTDDDRALSTVWDLATTSNGTVLLIAGGPDARARTLVQWNPDTGEFQPRNAGIGVDLMARSGDHSKVILANGGFPSEFTLYDAATDSFRGYATADFPVQGVAANHDGTQFAALIYDTTVAFFDQELRPLGTLEVPLSQRLLYSFDGRYLYVAQNNVNQLLVVDAELFTPVGHVPAMTGGGLGFQAIDETGTIFAATNGGLSFTDTRDPVALPAGAVVVSRVDPPQGKAGRSTRVTVVGGNFQPGAQVYFGSSPGADLVVNSSLAISVKAPPGLPGPVNVLTSLPNGWQALAPDRFSYGPSVLHVTPSAGSAAGGTEVRIIGYGFDFPLADIEVTFGGRQAKVLELTPNTDSSNPFPWLTLKVRTRAGNPGPADLVLNTPAGSTTVENAFHYLTEAAVYPRAGPLGQVIYDQARQRLYISNKGTDQVDVFALNLRQFVTPLPAGADPQGLALTPDGSRLVVTNTGDGTVSVIDMDNPSATVTVPVADPVSGCWPAAVATTSTNKAFVALHRIVSGCGLWELDLSTLTVSQRTDGPPLGGKTQVKSNADGTKVFPIAGGIVIWDAATDTFYSRAFGGAGDAAPAADGKSIAAGSAANTLRVLDGSLHVRTAPRNLYILTKYFSPVQGLELHPSGSLLYQPLRRHNVKPPESGILMFDALGGMLRRWIALPEDLPFSRPEQLPLAWDYLAIDETGSRIFVLSESGLTILELDSVPLSFASLTPAEGPSSSGSIVTIRGSGFQNGAVVKFANVEAVTTFVDENTLEVVTPWLPAGPVRVTIVNPDGEEYYLDAAFRFLP